jgi:HD superfamily phosphodiesterase
VVLTAAYLHDIGIPEAERKHHSSAARHQEEEGPRVARELLDRLGAAEELVQEVCDIIAHHHHPREEETLNFKAVYDADLLVNLEEDLKETNKDPDQIEDKIDELFLTESGRRLAREVLLKRDRKD